MHTYGDFVSSLSFGPTTLGYLIVLETKCLRSNIDFKHVNSMRKKIKNSIKL